MSDRERTDAGTFAETVTLDGVLGVFDAVRGPVITSSDVADALDCTTEAARQKLTRLYDQGRVDKRKTGRTVVYWRTDDTDDESDREAVETTPGERADRSPARDADAQAGGQTAPGDTARDDAPEDLLDGWRPGRSPGEKREQQQAAGRAVLEYLRDRGVAQAVEFKQDVEPDHPVDGQSPDTWWKNTARPALNQARDPGPVTFKDGEKEWRWRPDADADPTGESDHA
jgi:hypothetical protein